MKLFQFTFKGVITKIELFVVCEGEEMFRILEEPKRAFQAYYNFLDYEFPRKDLIKEKDFETFINVRGLES